MRGRSYRLPSNRDAIMAAANAAKTASITAAIAFMSNQPGIARVQK
jgi:hypothetical protein